MATHWQIGSKIKERWEVYAVEESGVDVVYIVYDHLWHEPFAVKTYLGDARPSTTARFRQEALTWVHLDLHQNITQARFIENIEGKPFLFLEYISGGDLDSWIGTPRLTEDLPRVLHFAIQICDGMNYALSKGLRAHRDLKPANCLITPDNTLKVTDFGLARVAALQAGEGGRGGTPEYMPPEQWDNFEQADERSDIYSFGAMLFEMLSGQAPFKRRPRVSMRELERRHKNAATPPLRDYPAELNAIIAKCLAKDPRHRFSGFNEVRQQLAKIYKAQTGHSAPRPAAGVALDALQWNDKGVSLRALGRHEEALECYDRALEVDPRLEHAWSNKGEMQWQLQRPVEAFACFDRALEINPESATVWSNKGAALANVSRPEEALPCCERAVELDPHLAMAWNTRGMAALSLGRIEEALEYYGRALELDPSLAQAWCNKGQALGLLGRADEEMEHYERALQLNPGLEQAWSNKGVVLADREQWKESIACYDRALKLNPQHADTWFNKGVALQKSGRLRLALTCFGRALELNPGDAEALFYQGMTHRELGQWRKAIGCYSRAVECDPLYGEAWYRMGTVWLERGNATKARPCFETAVRLGYPGAAQAAQECRRLL